ncbi:hypothetical protein DY000_02004793 [Brassica cretica]|uniref:Uncharacterized protein n=1 Tax=Brassica cretica TaxID=69181 RepID=A0ABQ7CLY8_BRACR|nr:hypothetical protein DY000_02004793 [Brassica cretica]
MLLKRNVLVETLPKLADKEVAKHNKLENIDGKWFLSKLGLNLIKNQTYLMNLWQHLSLTLEKIYGKWYLSKLGHNLNKTQTYLMTVWQHLSLTLEKFTGEKRGGGLGFIFSPSQFWNKVFARSTEPSGT